jgi:hypothetical protein
MDLRELVRRDHMFGTMSAAAHPPAPPDPPGTGTPITSARGAPELALGSCVLISALKAKPQYNWQYGVVEEAPQDSGRLTVRLEAGGSSLRLKPANLEKVCSGCKGAGLKLRACSRCKSAFSCGKDCIKAAWQVHKKGCGKQLWLVDAL